MSYSNLIQDNIEYPFILKNRFISANYYYKDKMEFFEVPDMDLWLKLKEEILNNKITKNLLHNYDTNTEVNYISDDIIYSDADNYSLITYEKEDNYDYNNQNCDNCSLNTHDDCILNTYEDYQSNRYDYDCDNEDDYSLDSDEKIQNQIDKFLCSRRYDRYDDRD
jgi:hypothetical protein